MVNLDPHHERIRNRTRLIHFGLIPLAIVVPLLWIYLAYGICLESESKIMILLCSFSRLVPLLPGVVGSFVLGLIFWELVLVGIKHHEEKYNVKVQQPKLDHAIQGYQTISSRHRWHIHLAAAQVVLVSLALVAWLLYEGLHSTH